MFNPNVSKVYPGLTDFFHAGAVCPAHLLTCTKNSQTVMDFLNNLWGYSLENAKKEAAELQKIMDKEGTTHSRSGAL